MMQSMNESEYIPIAALNHYAYCEHRCWRMFCAGEFTENQYTIEGTSLHDRVHTTSYKTSEITSEDNLENIGQIRAIWLRSDQYQLIGKSDLIESADGQLYPVEYKRGKREEWQNDALQVVGQALCLAEMTGKNIDQGFVYYAQSHQRVPVNISPELRQEAIAIIGKIQALFTTGKMPPAVYSQRCQGCSLFSQCLPQAVQKVGRYKE